MDKLEIFTHPNFAPTQWPDKPATVPQDWGGAYARRPLLTNMRIGVGDDGVGHPVRSSVTMGKPGFLRLIAVRPEPLQTEGVRLEVQVAPAGGEPAHQTGWTDLANRRWLPFIGPYCYLPEAGQYDVFASGSSSGANVPTAVQCQLAQGVSRDMFEAMVDSRGSHLVVSKRVALGIGASATISDYPATFVNLRRAKIVNSGAGAGLIEIGNNAEICAQIPLALNATVDLDPEQLGRHSVRVVGTAALTFHALVGQW